MNNWLIKQKKEINKQCEKNQQLKNKKEQLNKWTFETRKKKYISKQSKKREKKNKQLKKERQNE